MGYTTDFDGCFILDRPLHVSHKTYLEAFANSRRMRRNASLVETFPDPYRTEVGLPVGSEGAYFVGGSGYGGQDRDASIENYNVPPDTQPGLWCQWVPSDDGTSIVWDGGEKFYNYVEWINYLIFNFLKPWGYSLNGNVRFQGEDTNDIGVIIIQNNEVKVQDSNSF